MSSRGTAPREIEARRREPSVRWNSGDDKLSSKSLFCADIERELLINEDGQAAWVHEEVAAISAVLEVAKSAPADNNIDVVLKKFKRASEINATLILPQNSVRTRNNGKSGWLNSVGHRFETRTRTHWTRVEDLTYQANKETIERLIRVANDLANKAMDRELQTLSEEISKVRKEALETHEADEKQAVDEELRREIISRPSSRP